MGKFLTLSRDTKVRDILEENRQYSSIVLTRGVQSGKTSDVLDVAGFYYKESALLFISDKITGLAEQTNSRARKMGFELVSYRDNQPLGKFLKDSVGKKRIVHVMMEINNLKRIEDILDMIEDLPITLIIDEADKSRNTIDANEKKKIKKTVHMSAYNDDPEYGDIMEVDNDEDEEEEIEVADGALLPPITMLLLQIKNLIKGRKNSRCIFVSATPIAILTAEKDDWLVLAKNPYENWVGVWFDHPASVNMIEGDHRILEQTCKARDRWTGNFEDTKHNTFYPAVSFGAEQFAKAPNKQPEGSDIMQLCLISLENRKIQQFMMAQVIKSHLVELEEHDRVSLIIMNSDTKESKEETLADLLNQQRELGFRKVIIVAGFMASRGVSFTDYSDKLNQYELVLQIHYTKRDFPLNSSLQNMRIFGPARRTVPRPAIICNHWAIQDLRSNFAEFYRIFKEIVESGCATQGNYNPYRPLTQPYNFRYLKQGYRTGPGEFVYPSTNEADHLPIVL